MNHHHLLIMLVIISTLLVGCTQQTRNNQVNGINPTVSTQGNNCPITDFGKLEDRVYIQIQNNVFGNYPGKTIQTFFDEADYTGAIQIYLFPDLNKKLADDYQYNFLFVANGFFNCRKGKLTGENVNFLYCKPFVIYKDQVSESGEIGDTLSYKITPIFDVKSITFIEIEKIPNTKFYSDPESKRYKIERVKVGNFGCEKWAGLRVGSD